MSGGLVFTLVVAAAVTTLSCVAAALHQRRQVRRNRVALTRAAHVLAIPGDDFLHAAVNEIAAVLEVELVFAAETVGDGRVQTVAVCRQSAPLTRNVTRPPKPRIVLRAIAWCGCEGSPG